MESKKQIAEAILSDLMANEPLSSILLKTKIFASKQGDEELQKWVDDELKGYSGENSELPDYRIIGAQVKIDIYRGFTEVSGYNYPTEMIKDDKIRERCTHIPVHNAIAEIEEICHQDKGWSVQMDIPVQIWYYYMRHCISGDIRRAYQVSSVKSMVNIVTAVKSLLIDYFLKIDKDEEIDFISLMHPKSQNIVMNTTTYNAAIVNTGNGIINATNTTNVVGSDSVINTENLDELKRILHNIEEIMTPLQNVDYAEIAKDIYHELNQLQPKKGVIKRCLHALGGVATSIATEAIANQITPLISSALALI